MFLRNKDYVVFKIRYYASEYILNKYGPSHRQHWERAKLSNEFFWKLFEFVTKKSSSHFMVEHMCFTQESACEELEYEHDIIRSTNEGIYYYLIPVNNKNLITWVQKNTFPLPTTIVKKARLGYKTEQNDKMYWRNQSKKFTEEQRHKEFIRNNTRKVLFEKKNENSRK